MFTTITFFTKFLKCWNKLLEDLGAYIVMTANNGTGGSNYDFEQFSYDGHELFVPTNLDECFTNGAMDSDDNMANFSYSSF